MGAPEAICAASSAGDRTKSRFNILKTKPTDSPHAHIHMPTSAMVISNREKSLQEIQNPPQTLSCQVVKPASTPNTKTFLKFLGTTSTNSFESASRLLLVPLSYI